jgi:hypothetical protein
MSDGISFRFDEESQHVEFTHNCKQTEGEPLVTLLPNSKWTVVQKDPLTVTPSIHCNPGGRLGECLHGWITDGKWVSA